MPCLFHFFQVLSLLLILADHILLARPKLAGDTALETKWSNKHRICPNTCYHRNKIEEKTRAHLFLAIVVFLLTFCSHLSFYRSHFNHIVHFFSNCFCLFASLRKQAETVAERTNNKIKIVNGRKINDNRMWLGTQLLQGTVPLCVLFSSFSPSANFLWWFGDLYKFSTHFPTVSSSSFCLLLTLANHVFACKQKHGLPKSTWDTRNLNWHWEKEYWICTSLQIITKSWLKVKKQEESTQGGTFPAIVAFSVTFCSHFFLPFTFLIILFIFSATLSACLLFSQTSKNSG